MEAPSPFSYLRMDGAETGSTCWAYACQKAKFKIKKSGLCVSQLLTDARGNHLSFFWALPTSFTAQQQVVVAAAHGGVEALRMKEKKQKKTSFNSAQKRIKL